MKCQCGDDGSLYLYSRCHMASATWAVLTGDILTIECEVCKSVIARFQVKMIQKENNSVEQTPFDGTC